MVRHKILIGRPTLTYGDVTYKVLADGCVDVPADVEAALLRIPGFQSAGPGVPVLPDAPEVAKVPTTPDEIRKAVDARANAKKGQFPTYAAAQAFAIKQFESFCGGELPAWLTPSERAGLGLPPLPAAPVIDPTLLEAVAPGAAVVHPIEPDPAPEVPPARVMPTSEKKAPKSGPKPKAKKR